MAHLYLGRSKSLEAVRYGCYITHGRHTFNFTEIYNMLSKKKLSYEAKNLSQLNKIIFKLLIKKSNNMKEVNKFKKIGNNILKENFSKIRAII